LTDDTFVGALHSEADHCQILLGMHRTRELVCSRNDHEPLIPFAILDKLSENAGHQQFSKINYCPASLPPFDLK
jgi:hypothetical protein